MQPMEKHWLLKIGMKTNLIMKATKRDVSTFSDSDPRMVDRMITDVILTPNLFVKSYWNERICNCFVSLLEKKKQCIQITIQPSLRKYIIPIGIGKILYHILDINHLYRDILHQDTIYSPQCFCTAFSPVEIDIASSVPLRSIQLNIFPQVHNDGPPHKIPQRQMRKPQKAKSMPMSWSLQNMYPDFLVIEQRFIGNDLLYKITPMFVYYAIFSFLYSKKQCIQITIRRKCVWILAAKFSPEFESCNKTLRLLTH